jgi:hypothetical protein
MASTAKKTKKVKSLRTKALTSGQAKGVRGGADLLPAVNRSGAESAVAVKTRTGGIEWKV